MISQFQGQGGEQNLEMLQMRFNNHELGRVTRQVLSVLSHLTKENLSRSEYLRKCILSIQWDVSSKSCFPSKIKNRFTNFIQKVKQLMQIFQKINAQSNQSIPPRRVLYLLWTSNSAIVSRKTPSRVWCLTCFVGRVRKLAGRCDQCSGSLCCGNFPVTHSLLKILAN